MKKVLAILSLMVCMINCQTILASAQEEIEESPEGLRNMLHNHPGLLPESLGELDATNFPRLRSSEEGEIEEESNITLSDLVGLIKTVNKIESILEGVSEVNDELLAMSEKIKTKVESYQRIIKDFDRFKENFVTYGFAYTTVGGVLTSALTGILYYVRKYRNSFRMGRGEPSDSMV